MSLNFFAIADDGTVAADDMGLRYVTREAPRSDAVSALQSITRDLVLDQDSRREASINVRDENCYLFEATMTFRTDWLGRQTTRADDRVNTDAELIVDKGRL